MHNTHEATLLLQELCRGDENAARKLLPIVYDQLRALAGSYFKNQNKDHTLQPTALVHEAYLKMVDQTNPQWADRTHFFAVAATAMRQILTDHARRVNADKRGGGWQKVTIESASEKRDTGGELDLVALDDALTKLERMDARLHRIVELRFFGGLEMEDVAKLLGVSKSTVEADWRAARAWLSTELGV